jgi:hypothetical protein
MKSLLLSVLLLTAISTSAQEGPKVVVFNSTESKEPAQWSKYNLVKFNVFEAFAGDFSFYYERILNKNFSAEIGMGPTLTNYFSLLWNDNFDFSNETVEPLMGFAFCLGARYYPYRAGDEFYVAPEFKYKYYHNNERYTDLLGEEQVMEESWKMAMGRLTFGYVYFFDENIFIDFSAGFGIGKVTQNNLDWEGTEAILDETSLLTPRFHTGVKVGVAF